MNSLLPTAPEAEIFVEISCPLWREILADPETLCCKAAGAALKAASTSPAPQSPAPEGGPEGGPEGPFEISLVLADDDFLRRLNRDFAGKDKPTNVLAFATRMEESGAAPATGMATSLGDVAIAYETVAREAAEQDKAVADHLAHLVVHGVLHLLGFNHDSDLSASAMEAREILALSTLGIGDPYDPVAVPLKP